MRIPLRAASAASLAIAVIASTLGSVGVAAREGPDPRAPRFVDETAAAGIDHVYDGEWEYFVGGGVAAFDCDRDRRPDLYLAGGERPASLYRNDSPVGGPLAFERRVDPVSSLTAVTGAYPLDIDADGHVDLAVLRRGENVLLRGLGDCTFERANERWGFDGGEGWTTAFSATWEVEGSLPTLATGDYLEIGEPGEPLDCGETRLFRPAPGGDGFATPIALTPGYCTLSILFSDWDRSGRRDLRISNDRHYYRDGEEQLWRIEPGEPPSPYAREDGWRELNIWGMGIASEDVTGDGLPEVYLTSMGDNKLQTLADGADRPAYRDIALERGANVATPFTGDEPLPSTAWHAEFDDVNNDGHVDLFVAKGNVDAMKEHPMRDPNNLLLGRADGTFREAARKARVADRERSRGAALVDLDRDGLLDLVVVNRRVAARVWRNVGSGDARRARPMGSWLGIELAQPGANRDAIGAWIEVRTRDRSWAREVTVGGGHAGGQLGPVHVGLGGARRAEVRVRWPDGTRTPWTRVRAGRYIELGRGAPGPAVRVATGS